jgi:multidrug resistance efflux pump
MITLDQTLYRLERLRELTRSAAQLEPKLRHAIANLKDLESMLALAREKSTQDPKEFDRYINQVLSPQLKSIIEALETGSQTQLEHLDQANEQVSALISSIELVTGGGDDSLLG